MAYSVRLRPLFVLPLLALAAGCPDKKADGPVSLDEYVNRLGTALCRFEVACDLTPDLASCVTSFVDPADIATLKAMIASGTARYDAAKAGVCIEWAERFYSPTHGCTESALAAVLATEGDDACAEFLVGTVPAGGACRESTECAD